MIDAKIFTFLKVAELKNYTKAALALSLTQPAVTQHIRKLEEYYDCKLIKIIGKSVHLTQEGNALYNYANFQVSNEKQLIHRLKGIETPLKVGATLSISDYYLPYYLNTYMKNSDELFSITVKNTKSIIEMLLNNELYCAFIEGIFDKSLFHYYEFCNTKFMPVAKKNHPLCNKTSVLADLHNFPLVLREKGSGTREIFENYLYQNNDSIQSFDKVFEMSSFGIIKKVLTHSDAISFMYEDVAKEEVENGTLSYLSLKNYYIKRPLYFIYPHNSLIKNQIESFYKNLF